MTDPVRCWLVVNQRNWPMDVANTESMAKMVAHSRNRHSQNGDRYRVAQVAEVVKEESKD